ncbi:type IV pilus inner membrane component PilO [Methylovulum psychrotolerans]|jgi:type IV pilus assembly protein PilO|uniref:Pilus assembly protein PilO n=1 Tax=Methylovulum psychrotolerans TaxID=1704499 RepID=A0A1Z4C1R6_9GAMM|nr:type 4a pilus biogenesis protein PilO [Methylovulum psychrotolerans]ASF47488.1 pilus assembly protein PilO [Methylovulum psychrotolerans]MBT9097728.1 type 4a pilus biogenesis protein PilO [Methylovulum psychrotolerans]
MNLSDINWDFNAVGQWPWPLKAAAVTLTSVAVLGLGVYLHTFDQIKALEAAEHKEQDLKGTFEIKQKKAVNLQDYQSQLTQIEAELFEMIRQMPTKDELASLLTDISQTALASGLEIRLFKPGAPIHRDFYAELPISIEVIGQYQELGLFVSGLASLPRIVTLHDISIIPQVSSGKDGKPLLKKDDKPIRPTGEMVMKATVKTYNESTAAAPAPKAADAKKGKK